MHRDPVRAVNVVRVRAVVLAAGASARMGAPKALVELDGTPAVVRVARTCATVGIEPLVVLGHGARRIAPVLEAAGVRWVFNEDWAAGMFTSVACGVAELDGDAGAFFVHPVDCVLVRPETVARLARDDAAGHEVLVPAHEGRPGHPPLLPAALRDAVLRGSPRGGLRELLAAWTGGRRNVEVDDPHVLDDMDDPQGLRCLREEAERERVPGLDDCRALLKRHGAPAPVVAHCEAVAVVARRLGTAVRAAGVSLDAELLEAAALTHDVARSVPGHAAAGARLLEDDGYPRLAAVVRHHMDLPPALQAEPGEAELLYLADKLTLGDEIVTLARRRERTFALAADDQVALAAATARLAVARAIAARVEGLTSRPAEAIARGDSRRGRRDLG
jgi:CTP:molybdopterin cytidylyltransferase MocA